MVQVRVMKHDYEFVDAFEHAIATGWKSEYLDDDGVWRSGGEAYSSKRQARKGAQRAYKKAHDPERKEWSS